MRVRFAFAVVAACLVAVPTAFGADAAAPAEGVSPLGVRQQHVARMMTELERRFLALAKTLEATEPERAARLVKAFEESKTLLVEQRMEQIAQLLDESKLGNASAEQKQVLEDVRALLAILVSDGRDREKDQAEIERLKQFHSQIARLIRDEQQQRNESQKLDKKDEALDRLAKQIEAVEELIRREQALIQKTAVTRAEGITGLNTLADQQQTIRRDTEFVAKEIATPIGEQAAPAQPAASPQPGRQPLEQAAKQQQSAEQNLQSGQSKAAQEDEERALEQLRKALAELKQEQNRLQQPPKDAFDKMAEQQAVTANQTNALSEQVAQSAPAGKPGSSACSACSKCLGGACQSMQQASSSLKKKSPGPAASEQKKAEERLQGAQKEIEKRLEELGEKMDDETIVRLEDIFNEMLQRQQQATAQTVQLDAERQADDAGELRRADRITLRRLVQEERELSGKAGEALALIEEDGTSVSFPVVVANMRDNLDQVAALLEERKTEEYTQTLQHEIEKTLEELIEALKIAKKSGGQGGNCKGGSCKPPLLPNTAELKLLRALQLRVNRRTRAFDEARPQGIDPRQGEIGRIADLQKDIGGMVHAIIQRTQLPAGLPN